MPKPDPDRPPRRTPDRPAPGYSLEPNSADPSASPPRSPKPDPSARTQSSSSPSRDRPGPPPPSRDRLDSEPRSSRPDDSYSVTSGDTDSLPRYTVSDYPDEDEAATDRPALAAPAQPPPPPPPPLPEPEIRQVSLAGLIVLVLLCGGMFAVGRLLPPRPFAALAGLATIAGLKLLPTLNPTSGFLRIARWLLVLTYFIAAALALTFTEQ